MELFTGNTNHLIVSKQHFEESLEKFVSSGETIFIMGDFNIDFKCEDMSL